MNPPAERPGAGPTSADAAADLFPALSEPRPPAAGGADRRGRRRRRWPLVVLAVLLLAVLAAGWLLFRGVQAASALRAAEAVIGEMQADLDADGGTDTEALAARLPALEDHAETARRATSDPVWRAAGYVPVVGANFAAIATISAALDDLAGAAAPVVANLGGITDLQGLRGEDGRIDLAPLSAAAPSLAAAAVTATSASDSVAAIDPAALLSPLVGPVGEVQTRLADVAGQLVGGSRLAALLPPMLGADGPRTYLLLSLNSAELRSAGGIVGAVAELRADGGALELVGQSTSNDFPELAEPVLPLTAEEVAVHTDKLGRFVQNTVLTPDFPRTAELVSEFWRTNGGGEVDGVIATDPVATSYLLRALGPVVEPGGRTLGTENLLAELLHDSYLRLPDELDADRFYTGVASSIFGAIGSGQGDARKLVTELGRAGGEHRLRVWSAHPEEASVLAESSLGGAFLSGGADAAAGLFLNDGSGGKVDYFLTTTMTVDEVRCDADATTTTVRLDLAYNPPADIASYPRYVTGFSGNDLPTGWVATNVTVYSPVGGSLGSTFVADGVLGGLLATEGGRQAQVLTSWLQPGEKMTYRFQIRSADAVSEQPVWLTPTLTSSGALLAGCG